MGGITNMEPRFGAVVNFWHLIGGQPNHAVSAPEFATSVLLYHTEESQTSVWHYVT